MPPHLVAATLVASTLLTTHLANARDLRRALAAKIPGQEARLTAAIAPLASAIGGQIANQIPTLATSASFAYEFDPETDTFNRVALTYGPLFSERAITIGRRRLNINASYAYLRFKTFNGDDLDDLTSRYEIASAGGKREFFGLRRSRLSPNYPNESGAWTQATLDLTLEAQLAAFSVTYGLLNDLDINVEIPVIRTFMRREIAEHTLDERYVDAFGVGDSAPTFDETFADRESALGIGDIRLRGKYLGLKAPIHVAGLLDLALPTGDPGNFHGTGHTRLGVSLIFSEVFAGRFEPHLQAGVDFDIDDVDKSQARYLVGVTAQVFDILAVTFDFMGRSEFAPLTTISDEGRLPLVEDGQFVETELPYHGRPLLVDIERNDILEASIGAKVSIGRGGLLFATVILPLNDDGLRADVVPLVGIEKSF